MVTHELYYLLQMYVVRRSIYYEGSVGMSRKECMLNTTYVTLIEREYTSICMLEEIKLLALTKFWHVKGRVVYPIFCCVGTPDQDCVLV